MWTKYHVAFTLVKRLEVLLRILIIPKFYPVGDGNWYRGQVKDFTSGGAATIHFLDYGNTEVIPVDKLCKIPSNFLQLPFQAIKCSLAGEQSLRY